MKRAAALAAVAAIVLAACGGGGGKKTAAKGSTTTVSETSTTVAGTSTTTAAGAAGATATTKAGSASATPGKATVNGQPANNYQPPAGATASHPAAPGTYTYDNQSTGTNTLGPPPATSPLTVDPPTGTVQHSTVGAGSSGKSETTLDYRADGVHLVEVKLTSGNMTFDFVGNPPPLAAPTGVKPGQSVDFDLVDNAHNTTIHVHIDFVRTETITIGGQPVDTIVFHQVGTLSGQLTGTQTMDTWASQKYSLFVKTHSVADVKYQVYRVQSDVTATLEKVTPA
jgi:hypothetical protein